MHDAQCLRDSIVKFFQYIVTLAASRLKMDNLEKKVESEVTVAFRNKLICKKCYILPRPDTEVMRCANCTSILCSKCCGGTRCPLCQTESKNPRCSTIIKDPELLVFLSGFKTHPCINVKNGCLEEIPAKLDELIAHDLSCVFQKVSCPGCQKTIIFKDFGQHLKYAHVNDRISIYDDTIYHLTKKKFLTCMASDQFFYLNAYNHQFYPQFKEINNCLYVRTLMLGLEEEAIPFKVEITFFLENGKNFTIEDNVYPITKGKDSLLETSVQCHLKKLTEYYDAKTKQLKNQRNIDFSLKIISPKLDEIAKDQLFESDEEWADKRKPFVEKLQKDGTITKIWACKEYSVKDLLEYVLKNWPPKHLDDEDWKAKIPTLTAKSSNFEQNKAVIKVLRLYCPDKINFKKSVKGDQKDEKANTLYKVQCEEITKFLNSKYTDVKMMG